MILSINPSSPLISSQITGIPLYYDHDQLIDPLIDQIRNEEILYQQNQQTCTAIVPYVYSPQTQSEIKDEQTIIAKSSKLKLRKSTPKKQGRGRPRSNSIKTSSTKNSSTKGSKTTPVSKQKQQKQKQKQKQWKSTLNSQSKTGKYASQIPCISIDEYDCLKNRKLLKKITEEKERNKMKKRNCIFLEIIDRIIAGEANDDILKYFDIDVDRYLEMINEPNKRRTRSLNKTIISQYIEAYPHINECIIFRKIFLDQMQEQIKQENDKKELKENSKLKLKTLKNPCLMDQSLDLNSDLDLDFDFDLDFDLNLDLDL
jgi:hypothetical protein